MLKAEMSTPQGSSAAGHFPLWPRGPFKHCLSSIEPSNIQALPGWQLITVGVEKPMLFFFWLCSWPMEVPQARDRTCASAATQATAVTTLDP